MRRSIELEQNLPSQGDTAVAALSANNDPENGPTRAQLRLLYLCHALSTWNARQYEFAAILFTAKAFPNTLLMSSLRGLFTNLALLLLSATVGSAIDASSSRLHPMVRSISYNRASIAIACIVWYWILHPVKLGSDVEKQDSTTYSASRLVLFTIAVLVSVFERLSGVANMICMERDWAPELARGAEESDTMLTRLNATMRRIDLICKLISPLVISTLIEVTSMRIGIIAVGVLGFTCWPLELFLTYHVYSHNVRLQHLRVKQSTGDDDRHDQRGGPSGVWQNISRGLKEQLNHARAYFATDVWQASIALSLLHLSALSYAATFITFMFSEGFSLLTVTVARALGSIVEVSSTFIVPIGVTKLARCGPHGKELREDERLTESDEVPAAALDFSKGVTVEHDVGLARSGLWGLSLQLACLVPVVLAIFQITNGASDIDAGHTSIITRLLSSMAPASSTGAVTAITVLMIFVPLSLSRLGLWVFDLTTQEITQIHVPPSRRSSFAGTEMALSSFFELCQWIIAAIWQRPDQFRWQALGSLAAVGVSLLIYARWVQSKRGHLVHWRRLGEACTACARAKT